MLFVFFVKKTPHTDYRGLQLCYYVLLSTPNDFVKYINLHTLPSRSLGNTMRGFCQILIINIYILLKYCTLQIVRIRTREIKIMNHHIIKSGVNSNIHNRLRGLYLALDPGHYYTLHNSLKNYYLTIHGARLYAVPD